jgi:hypothetical protein
LRWLYVQNEPLRSLGSSKSEVIAINSNEPKDQPKPIAVTCITAMTMRIALAACEGSVPLVLWCDRLQIAHVSSAILCLMDKLFELGSERLEIPFFNARPKPKKLLDLFIHHLRQQLRESTVFVVFDNVIAWEDESRLAGLLELFKALVELTKDDKLPHPLKVMVTTAQGGELWKFVRQQKLTSLKAPTSIP